jgi:hypothetical protein
MDVSSTRNHGVRREILELVGRGLSAAEIRERLPVDADEQDFLYADSLVRVRDEMRRDTLSPRRLAAA